MNENPAVLLTPQGREILARVAELQGDAPKPELAVAEALRREYPASLAAAAMAQHELRLVARAKFARAMEMLFTRDGYEQSSSETIARYRAVRFGDARRVADLCCGIGGDLIALASASRSQTIVLAVDRDEVHTRLALHNALVYGVSYRVSACVADVRDIRLVGIDAVFIDPARRAGGRRFRAGVSEPPLDWCFGLAERVPAVCVKAAPGLPAELIPPAGRRSSSPTAETSRRPFCGPRRSPPHRGCRRGRPGLPARTARQAQQAGQARGGRRSCRPGTR